MFKTDGTIDKIFTGGAGKNGATVAVSVNSLVADVTNIARFWYQ